MRNSFWNLLSSESLPGCKGRERFPWPSSKQVPFAALHVLTYLPNHIHSVFWRIHTITKLAITVSVAPDVSDKVEGSSTPKRSCFDLQSREEDEEEDRSVRRSSRITRYKLDSRNQSVLYDRLITKWVQQQSLKLCLAPTFQLQLNIKWFLSNKQLDIHSRQWVLIWVITLEIKCSLFFLWLSQHCWSCPPEDGRHAEDETQTEEQREGQCRRGET